jgi:hypothetical protein
MLLYFKSSARQNRSAPRGTGGDMPVSHSFAKRQKELRRQEKQRDKVLKRRERRATPEEGGQASSEDPDLAGIVAGPQPPIDGDVPDDNRA